MMWESSSTEVDMDATALLEKDHREVEGLFEKFQAATDADERRSTAEALVKALSIHSEIEKLYLYPLIKEQVEGGTGIVDRSLREHQAVEELLARIDDGLDKAGTKEFAGKVERLQKDVEEHVQEEETEIFPKLRDTVTKKLLEEVGKEMADAKGSVPTRPHPSAPNEGISHELMGRASAVLDKVRDAAAGR
jgi:hemerythrin superfamily protein